MNEALSNVANGDVTYANPGVLIMLESMEGSRKRPQEKIESLCAELTTHKNAKLSLQALPINPNRVQLKQLSTHP